MSKKQTSEAELVKCEVCLKEVPASAAEHSETDDYVAHFCGLECYQQWRKKKADTPRDN
ncbi:MAG: DUF3330 domain-containing protein [Gammaproteobacteria bacterium]|nr:DUF3330 domain-containing protein [Gammaproteobacteria bacterium]